MKQFQSGVNYYLNIENIVKYCSGSDDGKATQTDITELYRYENENFDLVQKQINNSTIKNGQLKTIDTYKYDIVKGLIQMLFQVGFNVDGTMTREFSVGESVVWNTLIIYGFLTEVKEKVDE